MSTYIDIVLENPQYAVLSTISLIAILIANYSFFAKDDKYPVLNPKKPFEWSNTRVVKEFTENSKSLLAHARSVYGEKPYRAYTDMGKVLVIPPSWVHALRSKKELDFRIPAQEDSHEYIPGFDGFGFHANMPTVITKYVTKSLAKMTGPISEETSLSIRDRLTDSKEWHSINPPKEMIRIVSRVSSRIFMGKELCRDEAWTKASSDYTMVAFASITLLRLYPRWLRPYIHWFLPYCKEARRLLKEARECLQPHLDRREVIKQQALAQGQPCPFDDAIEWFNNEYDKHDPATQQISISIVAYHTTSDLLCETLLNLCQHPELFKPVRDEIITVLRQEGGITKAALYNMKLMDSVIKESQRLRPILLGAFRRKAMADVTLPNGDVLRKGDRVIGETTHMWGPESYDNALEFDPYRYVRMRESGEENKAHLVSTSPEHLGFGHGVHACPGRFLAANEIKILLCHLLLKYDWKLPEGAEPKPSFVSFRIDGDKTTNLLIRRRTEELDIDSLSA
ncbi:unnamed protein product [Fusarium graminearum]|nr:hypothetical protein FG05_04717 [Fusarium graminearum]CAF3472462.1 unnamed protein product [Fusarium graminearum]